MHRRHAPTRRAFTLVELMLVLVIIALLAAMAIPMLDGPMKARRLRSAAETVRAEWSASKARSMETGETYLFRCELGGNRFMIEPFIASATLGEGVYGNDLDAAPTADSTSVPRSIWGQRVDGTLPDGTFFADLQLMDAVEYGAGETTELGADTTLETDFESDGVWSEPVYFFADGTTSTAVVLVKNDREDCIEMVLRGLTGAVAMADMVAAERYEGPLDATVEPRERE